MKKSLNLFDTTLLVAGSMIGSGIFIVSSEIARSVGSSGWFLLVWIISGMITLFAALSYGELAGMMPQVKRPYKAFGYPIIPAVYIILTSLICLDLLVYKTFNIGMGLVIIAIGIPVYFLFKQKNNVSEN